MLTLTYFKSTGCMVARNSPTAEDSNAGEELLSIDPTQQSPSLEKLFIEIIKMNTKLQNVATDVSIIKEMTAKLMATVVAMQERHGEAEVYIDCLEETSEPCLSESGG